MKKYILFFILTLFVSFQTTFADEAAVKEIFNNYIQSDELKEMYVDAAAGQLKGIMAGKGKVFSPSLSDEQVNDELSAILIPNFEKMKISFKDAKTNKNGGVDITVNLEGKDVLSPLEINVISSTSEQRMNSEKFFKDFSRYLRMVPAGKKKMKITLVNCLILN